MRNQFSRAEKNLLIFLILIIFGLLGYKLTQIEKKERQNVSPQKKGEELCRLLSRV
jgi:predicted negative regulator of RcsB-dependent stress response